MTIRLVLHRERSEEQEQLVFDYFGGRRKPQSTDFFSHVLYTPIIITTIMYSFMVDDSSRQDRDSIYHSGSHESSSNSKDFP